MSQQRQGSEEGGFGEVSVMGFEECIDTQQHYKGLHDKHDMTS
jgi:hypothetical protein